MIKDLRRKWCKANGSITHRKGVWMANVKRCTISLSHIRQTTAEISWPSDWQTFLNLVSSSIGEDVVMGKLDAPAQGCLLGQMLGGIIGITEKRDTLSNSAPFPDPHLQEPSSEAMTALSAPGKALTVHPWTEQPQGNIYSKLWTYTGNRDTPQKHII